MFWWIVAGLVVVPLLVLAATAASLRGRVAELRRVRALAGERAREVTDRLAARAGALTPRAAQVSDRALTLRERATALARPGTGRVSPDT